MDNTGECTCTTGCASLPRNFFDKSPPSLMGPAGERWVIRGQIRKPGRWCSDLSTLRHGVWIAQPLADHGYGWERVDVRTLGGAAASHEDIQYYEAVVLTAAETELRCGTLTVEELHHKLQLFWPTLIQGTTIDDMHVVRLGSRNQNIDFQSQSQWYVSWLNFFINNNHCFGFAHAFVAALPLQNHLEDATSMLFELNPEDCDKSVCTMARDSRAEVLVKNEEGMEFISDPEVHNPRRVWDLCANKVIPGAWMRVRLYQNSNSWDEPFSHFNIAVVSHSWAAFDDRDHVFTPVNNNQWPVPLPKNMTLDCLRYQFLEMGCRYVWIDVLCMRQEYSETLRVEYGMHSRREREEREELRAQEWKTDVPSITYIYKNCYWTPIIVYFNGLGRQFQPSGWTNERHWLNRSWTIQETDYASSLIIGGLTPEMKCVWGLEIGVQGNTLEERVNEIASSMSSSSIIEMISLMQKRSASNPVDKIAGITAVFQPASTPIPVYDWNETQAEGWHRWLYTMKTAMSIDDTFKPPVIFANFFHQLLVTFPLPSLNHWFPSWHQVMQYPLLDAPDLESCSCFTKQASSSHNPIKPAIALEFSALALTLDCSNIYYGCLLLKAGDKYIVRQVTESGNIGDLSPTTLVSATPDAVLYEAGIDSHTQYILVDITPPFRESLLPWLQCSCIFIVCEEFDQMGVEDLNSISLNDKSTWTHTRYDKPPTLPLRRVTTLSWNYGPVDFDDGNPGPVMKPPLTSAIVSGLKQMVIRLK